MCLEALTSSPSDAVTTTVFMLLHVSVEDLGITLGWTDTNIWMSWCWRGAVNQNTGVPRQVVQEYTQPCSMSSCSMSQSEEKSETGFFTMSGNT